ncbi:hypothetical protein GCK72_000565 [Caenorhabditis remanei]|uniref:Uncharacterized protein n=1 Tax=Caenorhabditis remanei TaxID=31234 RepID=A0A6A5HSK9_CAERE|nr:hypothetical protein GCK72_000565 [Caenorhabditis remanei]KAF1768752.1 hypothetical protein GCK72_000565 [Caenorhabditis remanei]
MFMKIKSWYTTEDQYERINKTGVNRYVRHGKVYRHDVKDAVLLALVEAPPPKIEDAGAGDVLAPPPKIEELGCGVAAAAPPPNSDDVFWPVAN